LTLILTLSLTLTVTLTHVGLSSCRVTWRSLNHYLTYPSIFRNRNFWVLFGTCSTWFLLDISFYSQNLFLPNVLVRALPPSRHPCSPLALASARNRSRVQRQPTARNVCSRAPPGRYTRERRQISHSSPRTPQTDIGYSPKITLPYAAYVKSGTAAIATTNATAQIGVRAFAGSTRRPAHRPWLQAISSRRQQMGR